MRFCNLRNSDVRLSSWMYPMDFPFPTGHLCALHHEMGNTEFDFGYGSFVFIEYDAKFNAIVVGFPKKKESTITWGRSEASYIVAELPVIVNGKSVLVAITEEWPKNVFSIRNYRLVPSSYHTSWWQSSFFEHSPFHRARWQSFLMQLIAMTSLDFPIYVLLDIFEWLLEYNSIGCIKKLTTISKLRRFRC